MSAMLALSRAIDWINTWIGRGVSWLVLAAVLVSAVNASMRKAFDLSSNAWLELQWYLYGAVFLLAAAYTLMRNEHVRIDILYASRSKRTQDFIDLFGHVVFLLPFCLLMDWFLVPYVMTSFRQQEVSSSAGGLIIWPAKALLLAGFVLLTLQAVSEIIKRIAIIRGVIEDPNPYGGHHAPLEEEEEELRENG